jgi:hypothetical protein
MFVVVAEGQFARMLLPGHCFRSVFLVGHVRGGIDVGARRCGGGVAGGLLARVADIVARLGGTIIGPVDRLVSCEIPSQVLLELVESKGLAKILARAPKLCESTTDRSRELRHPLRSKDQQRDDEDHDEFKGSDSEHRPTI